MSKLMLIVPLSKGAPPGSNNNRWGNSTEKAPELRENSYNTKPGNEVGPPAAPGGHPEISKVRITENTDLSTKVANTMEVVGRIKPPPGAAEVRLDGRRGPGQETTIDYNSILLREKYGQVRGETMYRGLIERSSKSNGGLFFVVPNRIQQEKKVMMDALGKVNHPDEHHYQGLYKLYQAKLASEKGSQ